MTEFTKDILAVEAFAAKTDSLAALVPALCAVLARNGGALAELTYAYRMRATDTGYAVAFALRKGVFSELDAAAPVDVTVSGTEANLLAVFQRKLNPAVGLLTKKIHVEGSKTALLKLAAFL